MLKHSIITNFINKEINFPSIIIDESFNIFTYNNAAIELFPDIETNKNLTVLQKPTNFPGIFDSTELLRLSESISIYICKQVKIHETPLQLVVSRFIDDSEQFYQIFIINEDLTKEIEIPVFATLSFKDLPIYDEVKSLLDVTISNFPFTIVGEKEFKRRIEQYYLPFWVKNSENEITLSNSKFAEKFKLSQEKLTNREESEILPIGLGLFYERIAQIIKTVSLPVFIIRHNFFRESDANQNIWLLQYPILGQENKTLGIISVECEISVTEKEIDCSKRKSDVYSKTENKSFSLTIDMLEHLIKILPEPVYVYDSETLKILEANSKAAELYGYELEELKSLTVADLYAPENVQILLEAAKAEFNAKEKIGPVKHQKKDGSLFDVEILNSDILFKDKKAQVNVIQPLKQIEEAESEIKKIDRRIFNDLDELVIFTDVNGFITYANEAVTNKLNYEKRYLDNRPFYSLIDEKDWQWLRDIFAQAENKRERFSFETNIKTSDGKLIEARLDGIPVGLSEEEYYAFVIKLNKSETKVTEKEITETKVVENGNQLNIKFLSQLFHEILTPVNVILGFTNEIIEGLENPTEEQKESAEIIWQNQKILLQIMDAAGQYALLETGNLKLEPKKLTVAKLLDDLTRNLFQYFEENKCKVEIRKNIGELTADIKRLNLILSTVVKLAVSVSNSGKLFIDAEPDNGNIIFNFTDNPDFASDSFLRKLQAVFIQNEFTGVQNYGLSGIVIKLVKKLVLLFNAGFKIVEEQGKPKSFAVVIPQKFEYKQITKIDQSTGPETKTAELQKDTVSGGTEKIISQSENVLAAEPSASSVTTGKTKDLEGIKPEELSCFYFEDQLDTRLLFKAQMKDLKKIEFAESLEKALPVLVKDKFDFIIMDIRLQGDFNGIDALKIVKSLPGYENVPVIAVTAYKEEGDRKKFLKLGFSDYIPKPFLRGEVIEILKKLFA